METFQQSYLKAYPAFPRWWRWVAQELQTKQRLTTLFQRERQFFGRPTDDTTLREAIAFVPQSMTADRMNLGIWRLWKYMGLEIQLLAQVHDSVCFQYQEHDEHEIIPQALELLKIPLTHQHRTLVVPAEAKVGWNWMDKSDANPKGLMKYKAMV